MAVQNVPDFLNPQNYVNRELSWIEFNHRVLEEARDKALPLLHPIWTNFLWFG